MECTGIRTLTTVVTVVIMMDICILSDFPPSPLLLWYMILDTSTPLHLVVLHGLVGIMTMATGTFPAAAV